MTKSKLELTCPKGHSIPHKTPNGECTPMYCAGETRKETKREKTSKRKADLQVTKSAFEVKREEVIIKATKDLELKVLSTSLPLPDGASEMLVNEGRLEVLSNGSQAFGRHRARLSFIKDLPPEDADEVTINNWADKRANQNLPMAIAEKEYQLRFGNDDQRDKAADTFLRMTGRYQKEGAVSGGAAIILNISGEGMQLPYMPKRLVSPKVVDANAEVTDAEELP